MSLILPLLLPVVSFILGAVGAWVISRYAFSLGLIDVPSERSSHRLPTPKGGGIGILVAFVVSSLLLQITPFIWLSVFAVSIVSFVGDRVDLSPLVRLCLQFLFASLLVCDLLKKRPFLSNIIDILPLPYVMVTLLTGVLMVVFVVGTANFYNFMDGINGIAAVTGIIGYGLLAAYGFCMNCDERYVILCLAVAAACLGFLPFNFPNARVFMGDVGSVFLGFVFACMVLVMADSLKSFLTLSGFLFTFYADELVTMVERLKDGQSLLKPHRRHLYQVLANEGDMAHWKVTIAYCLFQLVGGCFLWKAAEKGLLGLFLTIFMLLSVFVFINYRVKKTFCFSNVG